MGELQLNSRGFDVFVRVRIDCLGLDGHGSFSTTGAARNVSAAPPQLQRWRGADACRRARLLLPPLPELALHLERGCNSHLRLAGAGMRVTKDAPHPREAKQRRE
jgi:hypothetical protein